MMKVSWGIGVAIAVLVALALYFFGLYGPLYSLSSVEALFAAMFLLAGLWTVAAALFIVDKKDRLFYGVWGVVVASLALFDFVQPAEAVGIFLIAIVILLLVSIYANRTKDAVTVTAQSVTTPAGTPAAT